MRTPHDEYDSLMSKTRLLSNAAAAASLAILAGGCVDSNDRLAVGDTLIVESVTPPPVIEVDAAPSAPRADDGPSLTGLDRSNWTAREFAVPFDGTRHHPHYRGTLALTDATARQRNEYPTLASSLELDDADTGRQFRGGIEQQFDDSWWARLGEVATMPFFALGEGLLIVPKLVGEPQALEEWSPSEPYERSPAWGPRAHERVKPAFVPPSRAAEEELEPEETGGEQPEFQDRPETSADSLVFPKPRKPKRN